MERVRLVTLIGVGLASACIDTPPLAEPVIESSHVEYKEMPGTFMPKVDVLVFIDDTIAMAGHQDRMAAVPKLLADKIESLAGGWGDVRLAVTSNDGTFHRLPSSDSSYVARSLDFNFRLWQNFDGSLEDVLAAMLNVGVANEGVSQPLEAIRRSLERNGRFLREDAGLAILIVTASDDASPWPVIDYVTWMAAITEGSWSRRILINAIYPQPAPRFDELVATPKPLVRTFATPIDSADYGPALHGIPAALSGSWWGSACIDLAPADRDLDTAGMQYDCAMSVYVDDELRPLPECVGVSAADVADPLDAVVPTSACWTLVTTSQCWGEVPLSLRLRGYTNGVHPPYRFECRTR